MEFSKFNKFPTNLKNAISDKKWTQAKLANAIGTTQQSISRWIQGFTQPDLETFLRLCFYLDEEPNELLGFNDISREEFEVFEATISAQSKCKQQAIKD